jgi:hypothetical protein
MGSHIKWWHVQGTYLNIWKIVTKPKPIGKCSNMILSFFVNLMIFKPIWKKMIKYSLFIFNFSHLCKFLNKKKTSHDMCIGMFLITLSHFERITWIFAYDGWHNYVEKNNWILNIVDYGLVTKSLGGRVHIWKGGRENKLSEDECEFFTTKLLEWIISPSFLGGKIPWSYYILYNDSQHNIPALKGRANKRPHPKLQNPQMGSPKRRKH